MIWRTKMGLGTAVFCAVGAGGASALASEPLIQAFVGTMEDLSLYRWRQRLIVIFAPSPHDQRYIAARETMLGQKAGLVERDIVVLVDASPDAGGGLRAQLGVDGFRMLLIGKDGGVKIDRAAPIPAEVLFATIDAMPMRQREMRED